MGGVHALCDVGTLAVQGDEDRARRRVEAHLARVVAASAIVARTISGMSTRAVVLTSPAMTTSPVVTSVSQATHAL